MHLPFPQLPHAINIGRGIALFLQMFFYSPNPGQNFLLHKSLSSYKLGFFNVALPSSAVTCFFPLLPLSSSVGDQLRLCLSQRREDFVQNWSVMAVIAYCLSCMGDRCHKGAGALGISEAARQGAWSFALDRKCLFLVQNRRQEPQKRELQY